MNWYILHPVLAKDVIVFTLRVRLSVCPSVGLDIPAKRKDIQTFGMKVKLENIQVKLLYKEGHQTN